MPPSPEYHIPPVSSQSTGPQKPTQRAFGSGMVTAKKVFIVGMLLPLFSPPIVGIVYSLAFIFNKETRREASIILVWTIVAGTISYFVVQWMALQGYTQPTL